MQLLQSPTFTSLEPCKSPRLSTSNRQQWNCGVSSINCNRSQTEIKSQPHRITACSILLSFPSPSCALARHSAVLGKSEVLVAGWTQMPKTNQYSPISIPSFVILVREETTMHVNISLSVLYTSLLPSQVCYATQVGNPVVQAKEPRKGFRCLRIKEA